MLHCPSLMYKQKYNINVHLSKIPKYFFYLEWETVRNSEAAKETVQTTQSATVEKNTVVTTQTEVYTQPVTMLQVSIWCICISGCFTCPATLLIEIYLLLVNFDIKNNILSPS